MSEQMTECERLRIYAALMEARYKPSRPLLDILQEAECEEIYSCCKREKECCSAGYCADQTSNKEATK